jgi:hypothetical protein
MTETPRKTWKNFAGQVKTKIWRKTGEIPQQIDIMIDIGCQFRVLDPVRKTGRLVGCMEVVVLAVCEAMAK